MNCQHPSCRTDAKWRVVERRRPRDYFSESYFCATHLESNLQNGDTVYLADKNGKWRNNGRIGKRGKYKRGFM